MSPTMMSAAFIAAPISPTAFMTNSCSFALIDWLCSWRGHGFLLLNLSRENNRRINPYRKCADSTRADLASQRVRTPLFPPLFAILAKVLYFFYVLVVVEIALGIYSLWDGYEWLRVVRGRLSSHAGFYTPTAAVICPCKGVEPGLEENLMALTRFDYANYEIYFSLATSLDPALKIVERVKAASTRPVHIVIAGPPENCGEKVHNLRRAVESLSDNFEVIVFTDSDVRLPKGWLTKLVAPLQDARIGATTAYRWIIPSRSIGSGGLSSAMASAWNASVATMLSRAGENFCWGGGTAIRKTTFRRCPRAGCLARCHQRRFFAHQGA